MQALHSTGEAQCGDTGVLGGPLQPAHKQWGLEGSVQVADDLWVTSLLVEQHLAEQ